MYRKKYTVYKCQRRTELSRSTLQSSLFGTFLCGKQFGREAASVSSRSIRYGGPEEWIAHKQRRDKLHSILLEASAEFVNVWVQDETGGSDVNFLRFLDSSRAVSCSSKV